jgi:hypothetical protein
MSSTIWRLADLFAKHHFLLDGLGWGGMPLHAVRKDLEEGRLSLRAERRRSVGPPPQILRHGRTICGESYFNRLQDAYAK